MHRCVTVLLAMTLTACVTSHGGTPAPDAGPPPDIPVAGAQAALTVGAEGGTLTLGDLAIEVPAGALAEATELRVSVAASAAPDPFTGFSPVFHFEPEGLVFARPVTVRIPFVGDLDTASVFWTALGGSAYTPLSTRLEGRIAIAETTHFSSAFVGTACEGDDCCGRANGDLDVLFVIDNSNSMGEEQASLAAEIPRMARVLATGDLDGDGTQDFPALHSVRVGTVSTDLGAVPGVPTCAEGLGDDGILRTAGGGDPSCDATYPSYAELSADDPSADVDAFVQQVSCVAVLGTGGCGFEEQLEAALKALTPSTSSLRFAGGTLGQGDRANAGFLRDDSVLATIVVTDENDCSASDRSIFDLSSTTYTGPLNLRCTQHPEALHPASRYVDGLHALRADPNDVIFAAITGVPVDLVSDPPDYDALESDPRMMEVVDPETSSNLEPSCNLPGRGTAYPPTRIVEVAQGFAGNGVVQSICQDDFTPAIDAVLTRLAARASGECASP